MRGAAVTCKFLGMVFILSLLFQGTCAAQVNNEANPNSNYTINDTVNGTIIGTVNGAINGTINDSVNNTTVNGTVVGTINGTINGTITSIISKTDPIQWFLILPILAGYLLFLCWMCRFFDRMNFCFVVFILITLITVLILWVKPLNLPPTKISNFFASVFIIIAIYVLANAVYDEMFRRRKKAVGNKTDEDKSKTDAVKSDPCEDKSNPNEDKSNLQENKSNPNDDKSNLIMDLHDIIRNFIVISAILIWPLMLLFLYIYNVEYVHFYGIEKLEFPLYIIAASMIGSLSYLLLSIEETFGHLIPEYKKLSIAWSYIRRILIAPFIALIGFYLLPFEKPTAGDPSNESFVLVFSFLAGYFTKPIEEWVYSWVQKILPDYKKEEFNERTHYEVKESDFIKMLGCDEDLAYMLYNAKIRGIEELAICKAEDLIDKLNLDTRNFGESMGCPVKKREPALGSYTEEQIQLYICRANCYAKICEDSELVKELDIEKNLVLKLCALAGVKTLDDLKNCDPKEVHKKICSFADKPQEIHDKLCKCSETRIQELIQKAKNEANKQNDAGTNKSTDKP